VWNRKNALEQIAIRLGNAVGLQDLEPLRRAGTLRLFLYVVAADY